jgi:hypothetical protein
MIQKNLKIITLFLQEISFKTNDLHLHLLSCNETHVVKKHVKRERNTCPNRSYEKKIIPSVRKLATTSKSTTMNK